MSDEMFMESAAYESDEADGGESDESVIEAEDSVEDLGEARPNRGRRPNRISRYQPARGVNGVRFRGPDGQLRNLPFPTKLATAAETNRGLASQEIGRRALSDRLEKLEGGIKVSQKKEGAVTGSVYLAIGGGLTAWSLFQASQRAAGTSFMTAWVEEDTAKMATLASATQVVTSGARWLINGRYHRSGIGMVADIVSLVQLAGFTFGSIYTPDPPVQVKYRVADRAGRLAAINNPGEFLPNAQDGDFLVEEESGHLYVLRALAGGAGFTAIAARG